MVTIKCVYIQSCYAFEPLDKLDIIHQAEIRHLHRGHSIGIGGELDTLTEEPNSVRKPMVGLGVAIWVWVNSYRYHYYSGMNIHFNPAMTWGEQKVPGF